MSGRQYLIRQESQMQQFTSIFHTWPEPSANKTTVIQANNRYIITDKYDYQLKKWWRLKPITDMVAAINDLEKKMQPFQLIDNTVLNSGT